MKFKIFTMLVTLGVLSVMPMIYMGKFNPLEFFDLGLSKGVSEFKKLKAKAPKNLSSVVSDEKVRVYKWRDKNGVMQFGNTPPPSVSNAEQLVLDPNHNVVQAVKVPEEEAQLEETAKADMETPSPYSVKGMKKVMDDARGIEEMLKQRNIEQQKRLNNL